tara:strand:+ start:933 stop:1616 length:684 start_codon:yes stop_codon:yes gene_type:complete
MAISVDTVYKTVLLILNKEQRGYMTPDEFNKIGQQVQLEIFEKYFEDLNQIVRAPQTDADYADRLSYLEEKISIFENTSTYTVLNGAVNLSDVHRLNTVTYNNIELQKVGRKEYYNIIKSPLTKPTELYPIYLQEGSSLKIEPTSIGLIDISFIKKPLNINWNFVPDVGLGIFVFTTSGTTDFELHSSEQTEVILRVLAYAGIIIRDPQIIQAASAQVQQQNINEKR